MNIVLMLGHKSLVGKDTAANFLREIGYRRFAFADKLKSTVADLYNFTNEQMHGEEKDILDKRYNLTPRQILQRFGQDQRAIYPDIWASYVFTQIEHSIFFSSSPDNLFCITDFRFRNEYDVAMKWVSNYHHITGSKDPDVLIENPTVIVPVKIERNVIAKSGSNDISEHDLDEFDHWSYVVDNNFSLAELRETVLDINDVIHL